MPTVGRPSQHTGDKLPACIQYPYQKLVWQQYMTNTLRRQYLKYRSDTTRLGRDPQDVYYYFLKKYPVVPTFESGFPPCDPTWQPPPTREEQQAASTQDDLARELATLVIQLNPSHGNPDTTGLSDSTEKTQQPSLPPPAATTTPWLRSQSTSQHLQDSQSRRRFAPSHSPTISILSSENPAESARIEEIGKTEAQSSPPPNDPAETEEAWPEQDDSELVLANLDSRDVETTHNQGSFGTTHRADPSILSDRVHATRWFDSLSGVSSDESNLRQQSRRSMNQSTTPATSLEQEVPVASLEHQTGSTSRIRPTTAVNRLVAAQQRRPRGQRRANPDTVVAADVHRVIQTVTAFHCDCQDGHAQAENASRHGFSLREMCRDTGDGRCFPRPGEQLPRPFAGSSSPSTEHLRADLSRLDYAQYLSTHPHHDLPRTPLRLRSTTTFADPLEDNFHVTWDVDSIWLRLTELSDLRVPIELAYTAQRHVNILSPQYMPHFPSTTTIEPPLHGTSHSVFAKINFSSCTGSVYVYWPYLQEHKKGIVTDEVFAQWVDGVVMPARQSLDSCAWQDHPKSFAEAMAKARHRREIQICGPQGVAVVSYTLSARYLLPLAHAMRAIVAAAPEASSLYQFRSFSFVVMIHDLKRALNAQHPRFEAFAEFRRLLTYTFQLSFLESDAFLDRSYADFGVEYNLHQRVTEPTTLLIRRTCLQHRLSTALLEQGGSSYAGIGQPEMFTAYSLYDAATGRIALPARTPASSAMPMIKGYSLYKHTCNSHLRHEYSESFSLPHLDLLCLSDELLRDIHKRLPGSFHHRTLGNIRNVLASTLQRLEEGQRANALSHTGVRIEPRLSLRYLLDLLDEEEDWPGPFQTSHLHESRQHHFVFAVATADISLYVRNFLQRMTVALGAQQFDLFGPVPAWDSITVRHRLGTTAVLLKIMTTFFAGDEHKHQYMRATKYRPKAKGRRGVILLDQDVPPDLSVATMAETDTRVRIGLMMDVVLPRYGCYWLPTELFDFEPRVQIKLHLLARITPTRPTLLSKVPLNWRTPVETRAAYQGDAVTALVLDVARELAQLPPLPEDMMDNYSLYAVLRMRAWEIWKSFVPLVARAFFRYVSSLTDKDPCFLPLHPDEFDVPFHALTYDVVTRLLGEEPILAVPRGSKKSDGGGPASWVSRLQYIFETRSQDQWQKTAPYLDQLRQWLKMFEAQGVHHCYIDLWHHDIGYLMRPFVWILPSCEKKTLFRLDKFDGQMGAVKRHRTRWHLLGIPIEYRVPLIRHRGTDMSGARFPIAEGREAFVQRVHDNRLKAYDAFSFAERMIVFLTTALNEPQKQDEYDSQAIDATVQFENDSATWFHHKINHREHHNGLWIPFWASGQPFPVTTMQELHITIREQQEQFQPEGGFHSLLEGSEDSDEHADGVEEAGFRVGHADFDDSHDEYSDE